MIRKITGIVLLVSSSAAFCNSPCDNGTTENRCNAIPTWTQSMQGGNCVYQLSCAWNGSSCSQSCKNTYKAAHYPCACD